MKQTVTFTVEIEVDFDGYECDDGIEVNAERCRIEGKDVSWGALSDAISEAAYLHVSPKDWE